MILSEFAKELQETIDRETAALVNGGAADFAKYREQVATVRAYKKCLTMLEDLWRKTVKEEKN